MVLWFLFEIIMHNIDCSVIGLGWVHWLHAFRWALYLFLMNLLYYLVSLTSVQHWILSYMNILIVSEFLTGSLLLAFPADAVFCIHFLNEHSIQNHFLLPMCRSGTVQRNFSKDGILWLRPLKPWTIPYFGNTVKFISLILLIRLSIFTSGSVPLFSTAMILLMWPASLYRSSSSLTTMIFWLTSKQRISLVFSKHIEWILVCIWCNMPKCCIFVYLWW